MIIPGSNTARAKRSTNKDTVLLVNADAVTEKVMRSAIKGSRHKLQTANSVNEAHNALGRKINNIALVIVDLDPGMTGVSLLAEIKIARVPTLAVTHDPNVSALANRYGVVACFPKPISPMWIRHAADQVSTRNPLAAFPLVAT